MLNRFKLALLALALAVAGALATVTVVDQAQPAASGTCAAQYRYGTPTRTKVRDYGEPYCDIQARIIRNYPPGVKYKVTSPWKLYEADVSSWKGTTYDGWDTNCWRIRTRTPDGTVTKVGPWTCF